MIKRNNADKTDIYGTTSRVMRRVKCVLGGQESAICSSLVVWLRFRSLCKRRCAVLSVLGIAVAGHGLGGFNPSNKR